MRRHHYNEEVRSRTAVLHAQGRKRQRRSYARLREIMRVVLTPRRLGVPVAEPPKPSAETIDILRVAMSNDGSQWRIDPAATDEQIVERVVAWMSDFSTMGSCSAWLNKLLVS